MCTKNVCSAEKQVFKVGAVLHYDLTDSITHILTDNTG
jgi:hypothetical protein